MKKWFSLFLGVLILVGTSACSAATHDANGGAVPDNAVQAESVSIPPVGTVSSAPVVDRPIDNGAFMEENAVSFVRRYQTAGHRTLDGMTMIEEKLEQSASSVEAIYVIEIQSHLAYSSVEEVPGLKGRLAYLNQHRTEMSPETVAKAEREISELRQSLRVHIEEIDDSSMRIKVSARLLSNGAVDADSVQVLVETFKAYEPAEMFIRHLPTDEQATRVAYDAMAQLYGPGTQPEGSRSAEEKKLETTTQLVIGVGQSKTVTVTDPSVIRPLIHEVSTARTIVRPEMSTLYYAWFQTGDTQLAHLWILQEQGTKSISAVRFDNEPDWREVSQTLRTLLVPFLNQIPRMALPNTP